MSKCAFNSQSTVLVGQEWLIEAGSEIFTLQEANLLPRKQAAAAGHGEDPAGFQEADAGQLCECPGRPVSPKGSHLTAAGCHLHARP